MGDIPEAEKRIPGEWDPETRAPELPGGFGGRGFGADIPPTDPDLTLDPETIEEHRHEGGGRP